jgi:RNA polymerase sigma-70 factor (ECF subfamily)
VGGDSEAFAAVFDLHKDRVYRHARRLLGNVDDAEDVNAGAFLELWRRRAAVRLVEGSVLPWLLVSTTNLARNSARGLRRYRALLASLPRSGPAHGVSEVAFDDIEEARAAERVRETLGSLSRTDSAIIVRPPKPRPPSVSPTRRLGPGSTGPGPGPQPCSTDPPSGRTTVATKEAK